MVPQRLVLLPAPLGLVCVFFAVEVMVPDGADEMTDFTRVVGGADNLVQAIRYLASKKRLTECIEVRMASRKMWA